MSTKHWLKCLLIRIKSIFRCVSKCISELSLWWNKNKYLLNWEIIQTLLLFRQWSFVFIIKMKLLSSSVCHANWKISLSLYVVFIIVKSIFIGSLHVPLLHFFRRVHRTASQKWSITNQLARDLYNFNKTSKDRRHTSQ